MFATYSVDLVDLMGVDQEFDPPPPPSRVPP